MSVQKESIRPSTFPEDRKSAKQRVEFFKKRFENIIEKCDKVNQYSGSANTAELNRVHLIHKELSHIKMVKDHSLKLGDKVILNNNGNYGNSELEKKIEQSRKRLKQKSR